ncbi:MAG: M48 family metallopeptidase [Kiritimatiellia bacterium]
MFRALPAPAETFHGYRVQLFRQGATTLAVRRLMRRVIWFAPHQATVGIFLPESCGAWDVSDLERAWHEQKTPPAFTLSAHECLLFGQRVSIRVTEYSGVNDLWLDGETLHVYCRRQREKVAEAVAAFQCDYLLRAAEALCEERRTPSLLPTRLVVKPLRPRILGQCTRDGEIRLNLSLLQWQRPILEETLAHERCHLMNFNHSPAFWQQLTQLLPDWLPRSLVHYL